MACFTNADIVTITIPRVVNNSGYTLYEIQIAVDKYSWRCFHRYKDFVELHEKLVSKRGIGKDLLPKKKVIGNQNPAFIEKRRVGLEQYLQDVFQQLKLTMPREFVEFLHFDEYDIVFLLQAMAQTFCVHSDNLSLLGGDAKKYAFSVLEMYAISCRLKMPCHPILEATDRSDSGSINQYDFSHVLDFCTRLQTIIVVPVSNCKLDMLSCDDLEQYGQLTTSSSCTLGTSNIVPNDLKFDLTAFRNLKHLVLVGVNPSCNITMLDAIRESLCSLTVLQTSASDLGDVLLCDDIHRSSGEVIDESKRFPNLQHLNISQNQINAIDSTIILAPKLQSLTLNRNRIDNITNLRPLSHLVHLSLSENKISKCVDWHMELGNLVTLVLAQNFIQTLNGFRKLFSLHNLDLSCNRIVDIEEVDHLAQLPCLENLKLTGNPVATAVDYRPKILSRFKDRVQEFYLDNEKAGQKEADTALVLAALRLSKDNTGQSPSTLAFGS